MRLLIVYQPESEHARTVQEFVHEFTRIHPDTKVELMDAASVEAEDLAKVYDIVQYPTLLVLAEDGTMQNMWSGPTLPLMNEVLGYLNV
jgi:hypothetical protein